MTKHLIEYDGVHDRWLCHLSGPGDPVVICQDKWHLEEFLDYLEQREAEAKQFTNSPPAA